MGKRPAQILIKLSLMQEWSQSGFGEAARSTELSTYFVDKKKNPVNPAS
jgi:hypothetical protein